MRWGALLLLGFVAWCGGRAFVRRRLQQPASPGERRRTATLVRVLAVLALIAGLADAGEAQGGIPEGRAGSRDDEGLSLPIWPRAVGIEQIQSYMRWTSSFRDRAPLLEADSDEMAAIERIETAEEFCLQIDRLESRGLLAASIGQALDRRAAHLSDSGDRAALARALARLAVYHDLSDALRIADFQLGRPLGRPAGWMSKGGPSREERERWRLRARELQGLAMQILPQVAAPGAARLLSTWFRLAEDSAPLALIRRGRAIRLGPGEDLRFDRFDLIEAEPDGGEVVLVHAAYGSLRLMPGRRLTATTLHAALLPEGEALIALDLDRSERGDWEARDRLGESLLLIEPMLRRRLQSRPIGDPALAFARTLAAIHDDVVVPPFVAPVPTFPPPWREE